MVLLEYHHTAQIHTLFYRTPDGVLVQAGQLHDLGIADRCIALLAAIVEDLVDDRHEHLEARSG